MDLTPVSVADADPEAAAAEEESSPSVISIPQNPEKSNSQISTGTDPLCMIAGKTKYQEYETQLNEVRENANAAKGQSAETMATNYGERFVPGNRIRGKRPSFDDASVEHRGENRSIRQLDENQNSQGKTERYASGSDASNSRNRENSTGRGGVKYSVSRSTGEPSPCA